MSLSKIPGVGPKRLKEVWKLPLEQFADFLLHFADYNQYVGATMERELLLAALKEKYHFGPGRQLALMKAAEKLKKEGMKK